MLRTSVTPGGSFLVGIHRPDYDVANLREQCFLMELGRLGDGTPVTNEVNFPRGDVRVTRARVVYEIGNAFGFRGATFIDSAWADAKAGRPEAIRIGEREPCSLSTLLGEHLDRRAAEAVIAALPRPLRLALAVSSTDAEELVLLARGCCRLLVDEAGVPNGLGYIRDARGLRPDIDDVELFETIANNPVLPDAYKEVMVLRPGVQGTSEIVGDYSRGRTHIFEYLRGNSYIPWGHFAANFAHDAIRYRTADLGEEDMGGLRHLYYQRIYTVLAERLGLPAPRSILDGEALEGLRQAILARAAAGEAGHPATLWGWNYGYDISGTGYRLHASHQMIHQQYALVPEEVTGITGEAMAAYACGDLIADQLTAYRQQHGTDFFSDYLVALRGNRRIDGRPLDDSLVVWEDEHVILFVPKAQTSQWEMQLMAIADGEHGPVGNVVEANPRVRRSLDRGILRAQHIYAGLGAAMVTSIEFSKRVGLDNGQRLLYSFLPKLPWSMGAFSEAQSRFILGHYPEDFALACRRQLTLQV